MSQFLFKASKITFSRDLQRFFLSVLILLLISNAVYQFIPESQAGIKVQNPTQVTLIQKPTLIVGSEQEFPPFATGMTDATAGGFTVDLWEAVAKEAGLNYKIRVLPFHQILQEFQAGRIDVLINLAQSDQRKEFADFTVPHVVVHGAIFVRKGENGFDSESDFSGKSIIVLSADLAHDYAISKGWEQQLVLVNTAEEGLRLLASGKHDVMLLSKLAGMQTLQATGLNNIEALQTKAGFSQKFSFAVQKGQPDLLGKINEGLALTKSNGIYNKLYEKWFGVYEVKEASLKDVLKYLIPLGLIFFAILAYVFYQRRAEKIQAQKILQISEAHIKSLIGAIPDLIWLKDFNGVYLNCNPMFERLYAAKEADIVGKTDYDFVDKELADFFREHDKNVMTANKPIINEEWLSFAADGYHGLFETIKTPMYDTNGELIGVLGVARDITARHYLESQTKLINERSQHLLKLESFSEQMSEKEFMQHGQELAENLTGSQIAFIHFVNEDEETIELVTWSRRTIEHYCHAAFDSHYPVSQAGIWADALRKRQAVVFNDYATYPHKRGLPEGHSPLHRLISVPVIENGKVVMLTGVGNKETDYTETDVESVQLISNDIWRLLQRRRSEQERLIAATAFESQEGIMVTDANSIILRVNNAFTRITGYSAEEAIGKTPQFLNSGRHSKYFYASMWESINNDGAWEGEIWNRRKSGEIYPEHLTITAVKNANGIFTNYVATLTDITMSKAASEEIRNLAFYDPLTQLPNRRLFTDRLKQALAGSTRTKQRGALLFLDLDHFKDLNDSLGHDVGDLLLQQVAERLKRCVREGDTVARLGGDEFVVLLEGLSEHKLDAATQAEVITHKILLALNETYQLGIHEYYNSPSIGVTLFSDHEMDLEQLLKQADIAMYNAKNAGRNTVRFFDNTMQDAINTRTEMERDLRNALARKEFLLYYQVQVNDKGAPLGAEALIRWQHPERGLVSPFHFITLAEDTGLILPIGLWVLDAACAQLKAWEQDPAMRELDISINVSAKQFNHQDFVKQVQATIQRHGINPKLLKLELTESMLIDNLYHIIINMVALQVLGVRFELDDFGTGYSSLQYLKQLPLYQLKIDQSFVRDIESDDGDRSLIKAIVNMAASLELQVIAEGVESDSQRQFLLDNGCTHFQGYLFGKPMPIDEFEASIKTN